MRSASAWILRAVLSFVSELAHSNRIGIELLTYVIQRIASDVISDERALSPSNQGATMGNRYFSVNHFGDVDGG
jgi:hypothetical protein